MDFSNAVLQEIFDNVSSVHLANEVFVIRRTGTPAEFSLFAFKNDQNSVPHYTAEQKAWCWMKEDLEARSLTNQTNLLTVNKIHPSLNDYVVLTGAKQIHMRELGRKVSQEFIERGWGRDAEADYFYD